MTGLGLDLVFEGVEQNLPGGGDALVTRDFSAKVNVVHSILDKRRFLSDCKRKLMQRRVRGVKF
jgi:hypothetical protein